MKITGRIILKTDIGFEKTLMATLFNKVDPGQRPDMIVQPKTVDDIIEAIHHAKSLEKKISVCSGGHSWSANHVRNESVLIDMSGFNDYTIDKERMTATAGPGVAGSDLLTDLFRQGLFFPAGHCKGVCLGGYLLQGGFAWHGRKLGMACESVLGIDIVTANGECVHANEKENADLYWVARGSGSGFFGVVVRFHLRLHKLPKYRGSIMHVFRMKYLEDVFNWAYEAGPNIPPSVEFQMLMSRRTLNYFGPGIEAAAPIFADTKEELHEAMAFMKNSPVKNKAFIRTPYLPVGMNSMYRFVMTHYPSNCYWGVDNMWTHASKNDLLPYLKQIAATLPPAPAHVLWLNWYPPERKSEMAFSMEDNIYLALYGAWKNAANTPLYENWASDWMQQMAHLSSGIQLADEGLHRRSAKFIADANLQKLDSIRSQRDSAGIFNAWHSRPEIDLSIT